MYPHEDFDRRIERELKNEHAPIIMLTLCQTDKITDQLPPNKYLRVTKERCPPRLWKSHYKIGVLM